MQKNKLKFIFILILMFFLFSCTKEIKESAEERNSVVKNEVTEKKPLLILEHTIPSKEEDDDEDIDFTEEEPPIVLTDENTPKTELIKLLESKKRHAWSLHKIQLEIDMYDVHGNSYEEFEKSGIDYKQTKKYRDSQS